ncbi:MULTISPECIES: hypothetical protein [Haloferax]|uniref:Zinc finger protein 330-like protein n=2 Tax=Haloferax gibbonsii TaxID=35746 RepID=A0A0K1IQK0_HALGI|nr:MULTISPECIES: hypothetical protein [Haloferax]AKU06593.1 zinc finger protein 330-like protein [Haloferax gibbonsii]ELZ83733.1 Zinc finger protein 330-like protein [Haloferax gibbonsii ATCC 33959]QOS10583.1 uncharacterized protein HfgLR_02150 [Haloferax gibbonsii]RDZ54421.1 hypothetical protein C5C07_02490 [Haloferax sp. Atlit-4N]REA05938.1 hypothetical protein DEQ92_06685 [Haloferax sp. Atlit-6N]
MPDTKTGREKKGLNKRTQLTERLYERELSVLDEDDDEPPLDAARDETDGEFLADELPDDD